MIFILLCQEAAKEEYFTTSILTAYKLYKKRIKELDNHTLIISFSNFKNACYRNVNGAICQAIGDFDFITEPDESDFNNGMFAMRIVQDFRF